MDLLSTDVFDLDRLATLPAEVFPDRRLASRADAIAIQLARGALHARPATPTERRGLQRFCHNPRLDASALLASSVTLPPELRDSPDLVVASDTSFLRVRDGHGDAPSDAGPLRVAYDRGYVLHASIAVAPGTRKPAAWLGAELWTRPWTLRHQDHKSRPRQTRESMKWTRRHRALTRALRAAGVTATVTHVHDREGDAWTAWVLALRAHSRVIARAQTDRRLADGRRLYAAVAAQPIAAHVQLTLTQARQGASVRREARLAVQFTTVTMRPPKDARGWWRRAVTLGVVRVTELDPPAGCEGLDSVLLTTVALRTAADAVAVVRSYYARWAVEVGFDVLKNALEVEAHVVRKVAAAKRLVAVAGPVAAQIAQWVALAQQPQPPPVATVFDRETLAALRAACSFWKIEAPRRWSVRSVVTTLAVFGGHERRKDRRPGWRVVLRGWQRFEEFRRIYAFAQQLPPTPEVDPPAK